jgi:hypothetical protein
MSVQFHRQAEVLMAEAQMLDVAGLAREAADKRYLAAKAEAQAFELIPLDRGKTRGIIAVSAVALFRRAGALDEAIRTGRDYLSRGNLPTPWQTELGALLDTARAELQASTPG